MKILLVLLLILSAFIQADEIDKKVELCKEGNISICYEVGMILITGENKKDQAKKELGLELIRKACKHGNNKSCDALGDNYYLDKHYQAAGPYLVESCKRGVKSACEGLGTMYRDANDVPQNDVKAREYYEQACDLNSSDACINVAIMYRGGFGVDINRTMEKLFYKKSCDSGSEVGCDNFRHLDNEDRGIKEPSWFDKIKAYFSS